MTRTRPAYNYGIAAGPVVNRGPITVNLTDVHELTCTPINTVRVFANTGGEMKSLQETSHLLPFDQNPVLNILWGIYDKYLLFNVVH